MRAFIEKREPNFTGPLSRSSPLRNPVDESAQNLHLSARH